MSRTPLTDPWTSRPTPSPPPDTNHLDITAEDVAAAFRPWAAPDPASPPDPTTPRPPAEDPLDPIFTDDTLYSLIQAIPTAATDTVDHKVARKIAAIHMLRSLDAQQPVEAALAIQAVLFHYASVAALHRTAPPEQFAHHQPRDRQRRPLLVPVLPTAA